MNELARFLLQNLYLDFQGAVTIERVRELLRASDTRESRALLARLIEDKGVDDMLVVIADCLKEQLESGINTDVISGQLRMYGESKPSLRAALSVVLLPLLVGASCGENRSADATAAVPPTTQPPSADSPKRIESLPQVSVAKMTDRERTRWVDLVNEQLSPCGDPTPVAACVQSKGCARCVPAARYLSRLVLQGHDDTTIEELYAARYAKGKEFTFDLAGVPIRGAAMAPVTIVEFSDFECPYCGRAAPLLHEIVEEFAGKVRLAFFHYPLSMHPQAFEAAKAAVAAGNQGKFWEMHDLLFKNQTKLTAVDLGRYAKQIGLDMNQFASDLADEATAARVQANRAAGEKVGIEATPSVYINGREYPYEESREALRAYIREELE